MHRCGYPTRLDLLRSVACAIVDIGVRFLSQKKFTVSEKRSEDYPHPIPRLKKGKVKRGYVHHGKPENLGVWKIAMAKTKDEWTFVHTTFPSEDPSDSDL